MNKIVGKDTDITIADNLQFILETKDTEGFIRSPYQILHATIYFVSREFTDSSSREYTNEYFDQNLLIEYENLKNELYSKTKKSVKVATVSEVVLNGEQEIDGVELSSDDRVLVKNQSDKSKNGIYIVSANSWQRSKDANENQKIKRGMYVFVENGNANSNTEWILECASQIEINSTPLEFFKFSSETETIENIEITKRLNFLKNQIEGSKTTSNFYYKDAIPVKVFGGYTDPRTNEFFPAWLNPDIVPSDLRDKTAQENLLSPYFEGENLVDGKFVLDWDPSGNREGDYFICWTWMPNLVGETMSAHLFFSINGNSLVTNSIPTHFTDPKKYEILSERYLPEMFKNIISDADLTPKVIKGINDSTSAGFTFVENLANQIIDLLDANATHEQLLPLLSNMFNLKLKSNDPTLWRRQIKKAIPNYKKKGTTEGLKQAFSDAGMRFLKLTKLWQVVSKYTYQEHFDYTGSDEFILSKNIITPLDSNFELWIRHENEDWTNLEDQAENTEGHWSENYVVFSENKMQWVANENLRKGDLIRISYKIREIPTGEQPLEDYIRYLPLMDQRDEKAQEYPPKNWNTRLIEEDDDLFDIIVPVRHPISDPLVWGRVRTEFPYSENAYNMDEYNGSKRDSLNPCDIDKEFIDPCGQCQSSKFNLDVEIENISDDTYEEAKKVVEEYMPFHSVVHSFNFSGSITEFVSPNEEKIETLIRIANEDVLLSGDGQHVFNRDVDKIDIEKVKRGDAEGVREGVLSSYQPVVNGSGDFTWAGIIKNTKIILSPSGINTPTDISNQDFKNKQQKFDLINIDTTTLEADPFDSSNLLEILSLPNRQYSASFFDRNYAEISGDVDPTIIGPLFEYRISNLIANLNINITQSNQIIFTDENTDFSILGITTKYEVEEGISTGEVWTFKYEDKEYEILNILPDGSILINEISNILPVSGWQLLNGTTVVKESETGAQTIIQNGLVQVVYPIFEEIKDLLSIGDYIYLDWHGSIKKYAIKSFKKGSSNEFYIADYSEGTDMGVESKVYRRIIENKIGQLNYQGIKLSSDEDFELILPVSNGNNLNLNNINSSDIKENYLIFSEGKYYSILDVSGQEMTLNGLVEDWSLNGEEIEFMVYKFNKEQLSLSEREIPNIPKHDFESIDRSGQGIIKIVQDNALAESISLMNLANTNERIDLVNQSESIEYKIEYKKDGE
jgi:hypothetical protein